MDLVAQSRKWYAIRDTKSIDNWYACDSHGLGLHRFLLGLGKGDVGRVDHRDGNGLNNQRYNLRLATHSQNMQNRRVQKNNRSGFKGVTWNKDMKKWATKIKFEGKWVWLGAFESPEEGGRAYDLKAKELFGEFARLNFNDCSGS